MKLMNRTLKLSKWARLNCKRTWIYKVMSTMKLNREIMRSLGRKRNMLKMINRLRKLNSNNRKLKVSRIRDFLLIKANLTYYNYF